jgi:hypothetical protein
VWLSRRRFWPAGIATVFSFRLATFAADDRVNDSTPKRAADGLTLSQRDRSHGEQASSVQPPAFQRARRYLFHILPLVHLRTSHICLNYQ